MNINELPRLWRYKAVIFKLAHKKDAAFAFNKCAEDLEYHLTKRAADAVPPCSRFEIAKDGDCVFCGHQLEAHPNAHTRRLRKEPK